MSDARQNAGDDSRPPSSASPAPRAGPGDEPALWDPVRPGEAATPDTGAANSAKSPAKRHRLRNCLLGCLGAVVLVFVLLAATTAIVWWLWRSEPAHWTRQQEALKARTPEALAVDGEKLEKAVVSDVTKVAAGAINPPPEGELRSIHLPLTEVNAWLATRLGAWLANQGQTLPAQVQGLVVATEGKDLVASAKVQLGQRSQVLSAVMEFKPNPSNPTGGVVVRLKALRGGRLGLPLGILTGLAGGGTQGQQVAGRAQQMQDGVPLDQPIKMGGRSFVVESVDCTPDAIDVKVRVLPR